MEKISTLMDGELGRRASKAEIQRLERDDALSDRWDTYHLIGDLLRREGSLGADFGRRLHQRLEQEPVVIAPHMRFPHRALRQSLPLAAGFGGVALVAWLAVSLQPFLPQGSSQTARQAQLPPVAAAPASAQGAASDYLTAHQEFSPSAAMQGVASYVRTVSVEDGEASR